MTSSILNLEVVTERSTCNQTKEPHFIEIGDRAIVHYNGRVKILTCRGCVAGLLKTAAHEKFEEYAAKRYKRKEEL